MAVGRRGEGEVISYIKLTHHQTAERRSERVSERERAGGGVWGGGVVYATQP